MTERTDEKPLVRVTVDGKPFEFPRRCAAACIYFEVRGMTGWLLGRERSDGQVDDIQLSEIVKVSEGDRFVTFPGARYC